MTSVNNVGDVAAPLNIQGMDLETILLAVQSSRANLLETQLAGQIDVVKAKNAQISRFNEALGQLNKLAAAFPADAVAGDKAKDKIGNGYSDMQKDVASALKDAGAKPFSPADGLDDNTTKGQIEGAIQQLKGQIDSASNSQQMDMLRLQSLSNKRNEAFELMTNFIKKMQDNRNSIIGNMR